MLVEVAVVAITAVVTVESSTNSSSVRYSGSNHAAWSSIAITSIVSPFVLFYFKVLIDTIVIIL